MSDELLHLRKLAKGLPKGLNSDWEHTNHFELTSSEKEYWWLMVTQDGESALWDNEIGRRFGLLMDIAEEVARLRDEGKL